MRRVRIIRPAKLLCFHLQQARRRLAPQAVVRRVEPSQRRCPPHHLCELQPSDAPELIARAADLRYRGAATTLTRSQDCRRCGARPALIAVGATTRAAEAAWRPGRPVQTRARARSVKLAAYG